MASLVHTLNVYTHGYTSAHDFQGACFLACTGEFVFLGLRDLDDLLDGHVLSGCIPGPIALGLAELLEHSVWVSSRADMTNTPLRGTGRPTSCI